MVDDLPLFASVQKKMEEKEEKEELSPLFQAVRQVNPDELSPKEALEKLYELKALLDTK